MNPKLLYPIILVPSAIILFVPTYLTNQQTSLGNYLLGAFVFEGIVIFLFQNHMESRRHSEDKRITHSQLLSAKVLHPLLFSKTTRMEDQHMLWFDEAIERIDPVKGKVFDTHMNPVEALEDQQAFKWTFQHLESSKNYQKSFDAWQKVNSSIKQANQELSKFREKLGNSIEKELHEYFPSFKSSTVDSKSPEQYNLKFIVSLSQQTFGQDHYDFDRIVINEINPIFSSARMYGMSNVVPDKTGIMIQNSISDTVFISCPSVSKDKLDLIQFIAMLTKIRSNPTFIEEYDNYYKTFVQIEENLKLFRDEIQLIIEKIDHSKPMEGKCELGY